MTIGAHPPMKKKTVPAGKFKSECLKIMDDVKSSGQEIVITKRNIPIVRMTPYTETKSLLFGALQGSVKIEGDIIAPIDEDWDAHH